MISSLAAGVRNAPPPQHEQCPPVRGYHFFVRAKPCPRVAQDRTLIVRRGVSLHLGDRSVAEQSIDERAHHRVAETSIQLLDIGKELVDPSCAGIRLPLPPASA